MFFTIYREANVLMSTEVVNDVSDNAWYIGVDVGGTFTDLVLANLNQEIHAFKVPSVPLDPAEGVFNVLETAARAMNSTVSEILTDCVLFVHGATVATNTVLEGKGAKVGLLTTDGFRDSLEIRRGYRANPFDHRTPYPQVLVPRSLRLPIAGRIDRDGKEVITLSRDDVTKAAQKFSDEKVEAVAVCLFNSFLNPEHERQAAKWLRSEWGGEWAYASVDISPIIGEYERTSTTVINAYVAPRTVSYLRKLDERLRDMGLSKGILLVQNNGGAISVERVSDKPATLLLSGPAAGVGALRLYSAAAKTNDLISMEVGGTSCDVILMNNGNVDLSESFNIGGYDLAIPSVDIFTIGAGGGTIAGVDGGGMLFAGPAGAGANPGPACYGIGGEEPTVTDAQLVLGRLRPGVYAGNSIELQESKAREAIENCIASSLNLSVDEAATGIIRLVEQNLLQAVQEISSERGHDPRRFTLVATGGAGPMHGAVVGRMLGCPNVYVPRLSGVFCALGMLHTNVRHDFSRVFLQPLESIDANIVEQEYLALSEQGQQVLFNDGFVKKAQNIQREIDLRYVGQQYDVRIRFDSHEIFSISNIRDLFEREHERLYGHIQPEGLVRISALRVVAEGVLPELELPQVSGRDNAPEALDKRNVWVDETNGWQLISIYAGDGLSPGDKICGPALIEESTTTVFVGAADLLEVDSSNNFLIHLP